MSSRGFPQPINWKVRRWKYLSPILKELPGSRLEELTKTLIFLLEAISDLFHIQNLPLMKYS
jgi:hypothetical protein